MKVVECPSCDEKKDKIGSHCWGETVDVAASGFRCWNAEHDKNPFHKDKPTLHNKGLIVKLACHLF
jgi:hypothetical protein